MDGEWERYMLAFHSFNGSLFTLEGSIGWESVVDYVQSRNSSFSISEVAEEGVRTAVFQMSPLNS